MLEAPSGEFIELDESTTLILNDVDPEVIYFSDRPNRVAGEISLPQWLRSFSFSPSAPNAAAVVEDGQAEADVVIVALANPHYDDATRQLRFQVNVLGEATPDDLGDFKDDADAALPRRFGRISLFVDDETITHCSMAVASDSKVSTTNGQKELDQVLINDLVSATIDGTSFAEKKVRFSSGTPVSTNTLTKIDFGDDYLLATGSTCVLLADGRVKNLTAVKAGDSLQRASGGSVEVLAVNVGEFRKGVHGIAVTENAPVGSGHMFAVNGVVVPEFLWSGEVTE